MKDRFKGLRALQREIGYRFKDRDLLLRSITHPSYHRHQGKTGDHNQRLEFLGDAILSAILADRLHELCPNEREGALSQSRSALSRGTRLANLSRTLGLPRHIRMSEGEEQNGGRDRDSILEDALEALIGAVYLDGGWEVVKRSVLSWYGNMDKELDILLTRQNPKGNLQELVQPKFGNDAIRYIVTDESGPPHKRSFRVEVWIRDKIRGHGIGSSKKEAEELAACAALLKIKKMG